MIAAVAVMLATAFVLPVVLLMRPDPPFNQSVATIDLVADVDHRMVNVNAGTDLPDGANVTVRFWHERNDDVAPGRTGPYQRVQFVTVGDGAFSVNQDLADWPAGVVTIFAELRLYGENQPAQVTDRFGERGERLGGPQARASDSDDSKSLEVDVQITLLPT
jgi:hypothetical protein